MEVCLFSSETDVVRADLDATFVFCAQQLDRRIHHDLKAAASPDVSDLRAISCE
jgi:hypothetical protein